ncbi:HAD hydrolase family protein [bacterium]|nr:HAD hydrolase family protein [bacterium]
MEGRETIRLIVADIDGCFSAGGKHQFDLEVTRRVREWNDASKEDPTIPALVFCTGRPLPYVQCLHQYAGAYLPSLAECGAVMWDPRIRRYKVHPTYTIENRCHYVELASHAEQDLQTKYGNIGIEAGKICQLTLFPIPPMTMQELLPLVEVFGERWQERFIVDRTHAVINFLPPGINKGTGLQWMLDDIDIPAKNVLGLGDASSDWDFMQHCGLSATPSNAQADLRELSAWKLDGGPAECVIELYDRAMAHNRTLTVSVD